MTSKSQEHSASPGTALASIPEENEGSEIAESDSAGTLDEAFQMDSERPDSIVPRNIKAYATNSSMR